MRQRDGEARRANVERLLQRGFSSWGTGFAPTDMAGWENLAIAPSPAVIFDI